MEKVQQTSSGNKRLYLGLLLIVIGVFWALERLNLIPSFWNDIFISWQMLLIGIGVFSLIGGNKTTGTVLIVIGGFFLLPELTHIPYEIRKLAWPILIVIVGVVLLITHGDKHKKKPLTDTTTEAGNKNDFFEDFVIFSGREVYIDSQNFLGGKTSAIFGGSQYDLRQAQLSSHGAVVDTFTLFGGCTFIIPPGWTVKNEVSAVFGGFTDKRGKSINHIIPDPSKTLTIRGIATFGGVEVRYT